MACPKCGRNMTSTTPEKAYCMKCDILIHIPSGVAYTGVPEEDKFIGSPAVFLHQYMREGEATLGPDALVLNWNEGKESKVEKIPYATVTNLDVAQRKVSEVTSLDSVVSGILAGGWLMTLLEMHLTHVKTLRINTWQKNYEKNYEIFVPKAHEWVDKLRSVGLVFLVKTSNET